jgi:hypothetical protein
MHACKQLKKFSFLEHTWNICCCTIKQYFKSSFFYAGMNKLSFNNYYALEGYKINKQC